MHWRGPAALSWFSQILPELLGSLPPLGCSRGASRALSKGEAGGVQCED